MINIKNYTKFFKYFNQSIHKLKNYYKDFDYSVSVKAPRKGNYMDSSDRGEIMSAYLEKSVKELINQNKEEIIKRAADMMEKDREEGLKPPKP